YKDKTAPDTIFIGRHEEFPDIALPAIIDNHPVRLTTFGEFTAADNRQVYLNIFSWFSTGNVEFLIVNFSGSGSPQHNC
ncbi:hypothetical protein OFN51_41700, partial [Escherichia coli]|nr:hypothetical protein [Escherichia coli]